MRFFLLQIAFTFILVGCSTVNEDKDDRDFLENSLKEIGFNKEFDYYVLGNRAVGDEYDYVDISTYELSYNNGRLLLDYVRSEIIDDSTIGTWTADDKNFSFRTLESTEINGCVYALDYSQGTSVLALKVVKL